jgi:hypothetical protein
MRYQIEVLKTRYLSCGRQPVCFAGQEEMPVSQSSHFSLFLNEMLKRSVRNEIPFFRVCNDRIESSMSENGFSSDNRELENRSGGNGVSLIVGF